MPPKVNAAEITDAYATDFADNFLSMLRPVVMSFFKSWLFCFSCFTGGKVDKIHLRVRVVFVISDLRASKKSLKITVFHLLRIFTT